MSDMTAKRRRLGSDANASIEDGTSDAKAAPSPSSSEAWQGWAEIESDPAFFSVMLKELGVQGVSVKEVFSLDEEMLGFLPRPVYGIIFLFKWKEDEEPVDARFKAGSKVWFANQTASNACASYALLNIINNVPGLRLGPQLEHFREYTRNFPPPLRGDAVANFEFVKKVHNSFARRMDKLNADLYLDQRVRESKAPPKPKKRKRNGDDDDEDEEAAHHFIAFVPIDGVLWKMDGLEWQPRSLGRVKSDDWLKQVKIDLESRMSRYEDGAMEFAILGLVKDPVRSGVEKLASNVACLRNAQDCLSKKKMKEDEKDGTVEPQLPEGTLQEADASYDLTEEDITASSAIPDDFSQSVAAAKEHDQLTRLIVDLAEQQAGLRRAIKEEQHAQHEDQARVDRRRHDCGQAIHKWLQHLIQKGVLRQVLEECQ